MSMYTPCCTYLIQSVPSSKAPDSTFEYINSDVCWHIKLLLIYVGSSRSTTKKNEICYEDMIDILESYKHYVPTQEVVLESPPPDIQDVTDESYVPVLLGGNYLDSSMDTRSTADT